MTIAIATRTPTTTPTIRPMFGPSDPDNSNNYTSINSIDWSFLRGMVDKDY